MTPGIEGRWRLLRDGAADGAWNMAVDEAILDAYAAGRHPLPPTLRLYAWSPPALSLGRGQPAPSAAALRYLREQGIDLVRRPTGGQAVLHQRERTYAVIGALGREPFPGGVIDTYQRICEALLGALKALDVPASAPPSGKTPRGAGARVGADCFGRTSLHEIEIGGRKVIGSAQLRRRRAFLQHGSIVLRADPGRLASALGLAEVPQPAGELAPWLGGEGADALRRLDRALARGFEDAFGAKLERGRLSEEERESATRLRCWRYDSASWTLDGRDGERERRWGPRRR